MFVKCFSAWRLVLTNDGDLYTIISRKLHAWLLILEMNLILSSLALTYQRNVLNSASLCILFCISHTQMTGELTGIVGSSMEPKKFQEVGRFFKRFILLLSYPLDRTKGLGVTRFSYLILHNLESQCYCTTQEMKVLQLTFNRVIEKGIKDSIGHVLQH